MSREEIAVLAGAMSIVLIAGALFWWPLLLVVGHYWAGLAP